MAASTHDGAVKRLYEAGGYKRPRRAKVTHGPRLAASRAMQQKGVTDDDIAKFGGWSSTVMTRHYIAPVLRAAPLMAMAGFEDAASGRRNQFWHSRFMPAVPASLVAFVAPQLAALKATRAELGGNSSNLFNAFVDVFEYLAQVACSVRAAVL